jgi:hypothetical protein
MMDHEKAIRAAKLTLGGVLEKRRAKTAVERAEGQIAPSKYLPNVPRQVHANGGYVPAAALPVGRLAVAGALPIQRQPGLLDALGSLASIGKSATSIADLVSPEKEETPKPHADRVEARAEGLTPEATAAMEALRKGWTGADFGIVSGYRSPEENRAAKGAKDSQHTHGNAYDVNTTGWSPEDKLALADAAWNAGFRGFGFYDNNMHFDVGGERAWGPSYSRDSIPDWAQGWASQRYGYAEGGEVTDLGQAREQKQLQTFHTGVMDDIHTRMNHAMEAHQKAVDAGVFDGYEVGDTLQGSAHPMRITGRYMQAWKPTTMALRSFERMGTDPTIIEHEGKQYIPMLRYQTGKEGVDGFQEGTAYLDGVRAAGYQKMGGLRAVKARGGAVEFMKGNHPDVPDELYHGNALQIAKKGWTDEIDMEGTKRNMEAQDFKEFRPSTHGNYGPGIYLSDSPKIASDFAQAIRADQKEPQPFGQVMKLHVSMKQPFTNDALRHPGWIDYIKQALTRHHLPHDEDRSARDAFLKKLDDGTATVRDMFVRDTPRGTLVNQWGNDEVHDTIRNSGFDGIIAHRPDGTKEYVAFKPEQVKSAISATKFDPTDPDITKAEGGEVSAPQKTVKAYKLFRTKGDGKLYPLFVNAEKPVPMGEWLEAEEGPQGKAQGKVKSKLGDLAYRPGWHAGDLPMATHIGGKSDPSLKKPDYRPDNHVWAEVEMAADKDWQSVADSRGKGVKAHITDQVPFGGFYRYKTNPNMTGNWLIGGNMKVNRVLPDEEVNAINDAAGTADLPRLPRGTFAAGGAAMFEGIHEDLQNEDGTPKELWHGTPSEPFSEFKDEKLGSTRDYGFYGRGHYLTPDRENAEEYTTNEYEKPGAVMGPLHAALKNPYVWDASEQGAHRTLRDLQSMGIMKGQDRLEPWDNLQSHHIRPFMAEMQKRGHDGVVVRTNDYSGEKPHRVSEIVVFKPTAIKHKDAAVFDPEDPNIYRANGGEVNNDNDPISLASVRAAKNQTPATPTPEPAPELVPSSASPPPEVEGMFNRLADKWQKSKVAYDAAKADGIFEKFPFGDVYKYKHSKYSSPMEVIGHRMLPVEAWGGLTPPKYVYHGHYPVLDMDEGHGEINPYSVESMENRDRYDWIKGKPRAVKKRGGAVDAALALTRRFTKR